MTFVWRKKPPADPMMSTPVKAFLWLQVAVCLVAVGLSLRAADLQWWNREPRVTLVDKLEPLRPLIQGSPRIDYLMDKTPLAGIDDPERRKAIKRRQSAGGQRFRAQYALAPGHVFPARSLRQVRQQARVEEPPYYVLWDARYHSSLQDVLKALRPIARSRGLELEHHRIKRQYALIVLGRPDVPGD